MSHTPTTAEEVSAYLVSTRWASDEVVRLSGGYANHVFRIHLRQPLDDGGDTVIVKHAKRFAVGELDFTVERQRFEVQALNLVRSWLPANSMVALPTVHHFDEQANMIIMDDCGDGLPTLKELISERAPSAALAAEIGEALGSFLGDLHARRNAATHEALDRNELAKNLSAFVTYGRLTSTLVGVAVPPALSDPLLDVSAVDVEAIDKLAQSTITSITEGRHETITMGDFWTGNVLVQVGEDGRLKRLYVIDWELAKPGLPGLDVGQMVAELHLLRQFHDGTTAAVEATVTALWHAYREKSGSASNEIGEVAVKHVGAHLVAFTPRCPWWGPQERVRGVVLEGVGLLVGSNQDHWLRGALSRL